MRVTHSAATVGGKLGWLGLYTALCAVPVGGAAGADREPARPGDAAAGYEIFNREWMPNDARGHGGDGLGPVYNDSSCVACHNSGGSGGAGPVSKNIDILSASRSLGGPAPAPNMPGSAQNPAPGSGKGSASGAPASPSLEPLAALHAGFRTSRTAVLHKFGTDPNYDAWRRGLLSPSGTPAPANFRDEIVSEKTLQSIKARDETGIAMLSTAVLRSVNGKRAGGRGTKADEAGDAAAAMRIQQIQAMVSAANPGLRSSPQGVGEFLVTRSQRNPTPLFGIGLVDAISDQAIEAMAKRQAKDSPEIQGRVSRVKDGRIGRLGWKGQIASVEDFVLNACAVELGLEVPGHHQSVVPQAPKYRATGLDLTSEECAALVAYVKSLPKPVERLASGAEESKIHEAGKAMFASVGCAGCHAPKLGNVQGIYSDLLLHDMGQDMSDDGSYSESAGDDEPLVPRIVADAGKGGSGQPTPPQAPRGATRQEWRTPPLWGFRDSGPYLHDGRAQTLEQAVAMHGGQAAASARKFFALSPRERLQIEALLKSLIAPPSGVLASR
jgi:CxxC motif-containing protein (DUF1111 family)